MTNFHRSGYYRTSKHGVQHWVSGSTVHRNDWSRASYGYTPLPPLRDLFLDRYPEFQKARSVSACFVKPNARCPVCGASVWYYQNDHGSRVFFDELGPPWPKHPCTDSGISQSGASFKIRSQASIVEISKWQEERGQDFVEEFTKLYRNDPWPLATIVKRIKSAKRVFVVLQLLKQGRPTKVYLSCKKFPKCCNEGYVISISGRKISFFDTSLMSDSEVEIKRYRGAAAFIEAMIEAKTG